MVICGGPGFLGAVGTCACIRYQALFPPGDEAVQEDTHRLHELVILHVCDER